MSGFPINSLFDGLPIEIVSGEASTVPAMPNDTRHSSALMSSLVANHDQKEKRKVTRISYDPQNWKNPWVAIRVTAMQSGEGRAIEDNLAFWGNCFLTGEDPKDYPDTTMRAQILEAKTNNEMRKHFDLLGSILMVDRRHKVKSYQAIHTARQSRYMRRLQKYRWERLFKSTNNREAHTRSWSEFTRDFRDDVLGFQRRILYFTAHQLLEKIDEHYKGLEHGLEKHRYLCVAAFQIAGQLTEELEQDKTELERVYREYKGDPPAFYQSSWSGPMTEADM